MAKSLLLNQVTLCADGSIGLQWIKRIVVDGEVVLSEPHRAVVSYDETIDRALDGTYRHLEAMGYVLSAAEKAAHLERVAAVDAVGRADPAIQAARQAKISASRV